jgi:hypothetical protein
VGFTLPSSAGYTNYGPLVENWDTQSWTPGPTPAAPGTSLLVGGAGISCLVTTGCTAAWGPLVDRYS